MKHKLLLGIVLVGLLVMPVSTFAAQTMAQRMSGRLLVQVQANGESWYVSPTDNHRYFLGRPADMYAIMRQFGLGITSKDLNNIPVGLFPSYSTDTDGDGLSDNMEKALGTKINDTDTDDDGYTDRAEILNDYSPFNPKSVKLWYNTAMTNRLSGRILIAVDNLGAAWYVNPTDKHRYYLESPDLVFKMMQDNRFATGISNADIAQIPVGTLTNYTYTTPNVGPTYPVVTSSGVSTTGNCPSNSFDDYRVKEDLLNPSWIGTYAELTSNTSLDRSNYENTIRPNMTQLMTTANVNKYALIAKYRTAYSYAQGVGVKVGSRGSDRISLQGIQCAAWLDNLTVRDYTIDNFYPISDISHLQYLALENVTLDNFMGKEMPNVKTLIVKNSTINNWSYIFRMPNLEAIEISGTNQPPLMQLQPLKNLKSLKINGSTISLPIR